MANVTVIVFECHLKVSVGIPVEYNATAALMLNSVGPRARAHSFISCTQPAAYEALSSGKKTGGLPLFQVLSCSLSNCAVRQISFRVGIRLSGLALRK